MIYLFLFILGLSVGSFLNVLIDRLPLGKKITGRSYCDHCRHQLAWHDLIPIISFFLLRAKCRYCGKKISWQYPLVETITGVIFILIFNFQFSVFNEFSISQFSMNWSFSHWDLIVNWILKIGILSCLIVIFFSDLKYQIIPDSMQVVLFIFALIYHIVMTQITPTRCNLACYGGSGIVVMLPILFLWLVTRGRGMGFGDVKLAFNIGFLLGIKGGLLAIYFGFITGGIIGIILLLARKKKLKSKIAFGPFLVLGILIMMFWQKQVFEIINKIYGL
jgi:leader peptidase (prepilin peptidase)/N-methyltransferase